MIYTKKNDDTNIIVSQVLTNEESSYINSLSVIPIIIDNDRYVVDNTYINKVSEDYDISREDSIGLLEDINNIDNLTIAISDIDSIIDPTLLTESSNFIIYPQSELTEEYDYYEDILQAVFDEDNESLLEYLDIEDDLNILNERQISKEDLESQKERLNKSIVNKIGKSSNFGFNTGKTKQSGFLNYAKYSDGDTIDQFNFIKNHYPDMYKIMVKTTTNPDGTEDRKLDLAILNKVVKKIKQENEDPDKHFKSISPIDAKISINARNKLRSIYGKNIIDHKGKLRDDLSFKQKAEIRKILRKYENEEEDKVHNANINYTMYTNSNKIRDKTNKNLSPQTINVKNANIPKRYQTSTNTTNVQDKTIDAIVDKLSNSNKQDLLALHSALKHNKKVLRRQEKISKRLKSIQNDPNQRPASQDQNVTIKINGKKRLIRQKKGETINQARQRYIERDKEIQKAEESKTKLVSSAPSSPTPDKKEEPKREVVTVQKQGEKTKSDSPRDGETTKDTVERLSTQNQPLQLEYRPTVNKNAFIKQTDTQLKSPTKSSSKTEEKPKTETKKTKNNEKDTPNRVLKSRPLQLEYHPEDNKQKEEPSKKEEKRVFNTKKTVKTPEVIKLGHDAPKTEDKPNRVIPSSSSTSKEESPKSTQSEPAKPKTTPTSSTNNTTSKPATSSTNRPSTATVPTAVKQDLNKDKTNISRIAKIGGGLAAAGGAYAAARKIASLKNLQNKWARKLLLLPPTKRSIVQRILDKIKQTIHKLSSRR